MVVVESIIKYESVINSRLLSNKTIDKIQPFFTNIILLKHTTSSR